MLDVIFSKSLITPLEIAKWVFVVLFVASTIGVIVGVYWEGDKFASDKDKQHRGWLLLLLSLAAETAFGVLIFAADGWISEIQSHEIATLETKLAPRELAKDQLDALSVVAKHFPGQQYWLSVAPGAEPAALMCSIKKVLNEAGWMRIKEFGTSLRLDPFCGDGEQVGVNFGSYVRLWIRPDAPESTQRAQSELTDVFKTDAVDVFAHKEPNPDMDKATIHVMIGAKL